MLLNYKATPTCARFMKSEAEIRLIAGPIGSGKTIACIMEFLRRAMQQVPSKEDGIRYTRFAIVRQTLKQLKDTVLKDILQWLGPLATHHVQDSVVKIRFGDVVSEWMLIPLEDPEDQRRLLSSQLTGAWMSEAIEMHYDLVAPLLGRCARYPSGLQGGCTWSGIICDTNFPSEGTDWHRVMENPPPHWQIFKQVGGLHPLAENLNWLKQTAETLQLPLEHPARIARGRLYYQQIKDEHRNPDWIRRYVDAEYGNDPSGSAVFRETFKRSFHVAKLEPSQAQQGFKFALTPSFEYPLLITQDFGRNPCALITQPDHKGRLLVLQEVVSEDMGLEYHLKSRLLPILNTHRFASLPMYVIGDPAGMSKNTHYEETSFDLIKTIGLQAYPAPTNDIEKRISAVDGFLLQQRDGGAALLIDEEGCPKLVLAMNGDYKYVKKKDGQLHHIPEKKHPESDLADCLQYACLVAHGGLSSYLANRLMRPVRTVPLRKVVAQGWT